MILPHRIREHRSGGLAQRGLLRCWALLFLAVVTTFGATRAFGSDPRQRLMARVYAEYPRLNPQHGKYDRLSDWDKVRMLCDFSHRNTAYSNNVASAAYKAGSATVDRVVRGEAALIDAYEFFDRSGGGVVCGHTASLLQMLLTEFGFDAWTVGHGFSPRTAKGSCFSHAEVLVRIVDGSGSKRRTIVTLHDPSTNLSYTRADGRTPIDYFELLELVCQGAADRVGTSTGVDDGVQRSNPATVCLADETRDKTIDDYLGSWNIHDYERRLIELDDGRWRVESPRDFSEFDRLGDVIWKPELRREGQPGETIYLHCFPFSVSGTRSEADELLARAKEVAAKNLNSRKRVDNSRDTKFPLPGEWPQARGNRTLDGHAEGQGSISDPKIAWKHFVGRLESTIVVEPGQGTSRLSLPADRKRQSVAIDGAWTRRWFPSAPRGVIAGVEQPLIPTSTTTFADVLPDIPGLEKVQFASGFELPTKNGEWQYGPGSLSAWKDGKWEPVWRTKPIDHCFNPYPIVGDFDNDGQLEVAALPWRALHILDARTGQLESDCPFTEGRSYGFFGAFDVDDDGKSEFVVLSDFAKHVEVMGYRNGKVELLWQHEIELDISNPQKIFHVLPEPVVDVDGDGVKEVILNLFNDTGDSKWHVVVRDGLTGAVKVDLADEITQGTADLDADGRYELLTVATQGRFVPDLGTVRVRSWQDGALSVRWEEAERGWSQQSAPIALHCWRNDRHLPAVLVHSTKHGPAVVLRSAAAGNEYFELLVSHWKDNAFQGGMTVRGPNLEAVALDDSGALLAKCSAPPGTATEIFVYNGRVDCVGTAEDAGSLAPPIVARDVRSPRPIIVSAGAKDDVMVWHPPTGDDVARQLWRVRGARGPAPVVMDARGNGKRYVIYGSRSTSGCAQVVMADGLTGEAVWHHDLPRFADNSSAWNPGGFISWYAGNFTSKTRQDVLVTISRSMMHGEETFLLSGDDGRELWHRPRQIAQRSVSGPFAVADYNGDGFDDAASFYPSIHYILDGPTGRDLLAGENRWKGLPIKTVYWGRPVAFTPAKGDPAIVFASTHMVGLVRRDGKLAWTDAYDKGTACMPTLADFDGDGTRELFFAAFDDGSRCYDANEGSVKWTLPVARGAHVDAVVSGDINSDGQDEALFVVGSRLYCVGAAKDASRGQSIWSFDLPALASSPALASVINASRDSQPRLSVLLSGGDGYVYCLD